MIDQALLEKTLTTATARGGEFAEIFVEDRQSSGALLDDDRIEELSSGRSRGAGIRVLVVTQPDLLTPQISAKTVWLPLPKPLQTRPATATEV